LDIGTECKTDNNVGPSPGCDLYMYDFDRPVGERLIQVSAGDASDPEKGKDAEVTGVTAISGDGSHAYFIARGALTTSSNSLGQTAQAGDRNLYLYERDATHPEGRTVFVARLQSSCAATGDFDCKDLVGPMASNFARALPMVGADPADNSVGGDGHMLAFITYESLSSEDADGVQRDIYLYDADANTLKLISGGAIGGSSNGPFSIRTRAPGTGVSVFPNFAQRNRWVSEDGKTFAFATNEALAPSDNNEENDVYAWVDGKLVKLPGPQVESVSVAQTGGAIAFDTFRPLVALDRDTTGDVYVARVNGGFPTPVERQLCEAEACQGPASLGPGPGGAASSSFTGPGNVKKAPKAKKHQHKKRHRKHKRNAAHKHQGGQK